METMTDLNDINSFYSEMNSGGLKEYNNEDQALVFQFESNGGPREDDIFLLSFKYVELFHLPINLSCPVDGKSLDEIVIVPENELATILPNVDEEITYKNNDYRCYRFLADGLATDFYIYCLSVEGTLL